MSILIGIYVYQVRPSSSGDVRANRDPFCLVRESECVSIGTNEQGIVSCSGEIYPFTVLTCRRLNSIGLEVVPSDVLALKLLTPSTFLVVNIMQLYYFQSSWMKLITMPR